MEVRRLPVSRDTRRLITIVIVAAALLWVLAEIRFPDRPATPVGPVLAQLAPAPALDDIVASIASLAPRVEPLLSGIAVETTPGGMQAVRPALRLEGDLAALLLDDAVAIAPQAKATGIQLVARDPASKLGVVRLPASRAVTLEAWSPRRLAAPRFLISADGSNEGHSLRPIFVASLRETSSVYWPGSVWTPPPDTDARPGSFVFTTDGMVAGMTVLHRGLVAIVPIDALRTAARQLIDRDARPPGRIGVDTQLLTPPLASSLSASGGVVVTWVDRDGPAQGVLKVTDVIERLDGQPIIDPDQWLVRMLRLSVDDVIKVAVRRSGELFDASITAVDRPGTARTSSLGLTMRRVAHSGSQVVAVDPGSAAARAGLRAGDVITRVGAFEAPTPARISRVFDETANDRPLVVAVTRGDRHEVLTLDKH